MVLFHRIGQIILEALLLKGVNVYGMETDIWGVPGRFSMTFCFFTRGAWGSMASSPSMSFISAAVIFEDRRPRHAEH